MSGFFLFVCLFSRRKRAEWLWTQSRIWFTLASGFRVGFYVRVDSSRGCRKCRDAERNAVAGGDHAGEISTNPILWISAVSNHCQPAPIKEDSTSLKRRWFIRPQHCAALMVIIASKVAPQFSRGPIWKVSHLNLWVLRWMSLISDFIFNYVLTHRSPVFIRTWRERSFTSSSMSRCGPKRSAPVSKVRVWSAGACGPRCYMSDGV